MQSNSLSNSLDYHNMIGIPLNKKIKDTDNVVLTRNINMSKLDISRGISNGKKNVNVCGKILNVGNQFQDVWLYGGNYPFLQQKKNIYVQSNNSQDDINGLGAQKIIIEGLNGKGKEISETVFLNGNSIVNTNKNFLRVNCACIKETGTYGGSNYSDIRIYSDDNNLSIISGYDIGSTGTSRYGDSISKVAAYSVPDNYTAYISEITINTNNNSDIVLNTRAEYDKTNKPKPRISILEFKSINGLHNVKYDSYLKIEECSDIWFSARANVGNSDVYIYLDLVLIENGG
jgi:hypothetical protein